MKYLIVGPAGHGVTEYALGLARATGAEVIREETFGDTPLAGPVHVTFTDHLFGDTAERLLARIDGPLSVSLHDIPSPRKAPSATHAAHASTASSSKRRTSRWSTPTTRPPFSTPRQP